MTLIKSIDLGQYISLVNEKPIKFMVRADQHKPDSGDLLGRIPFYLFFTQIAPSGSDAIEFVVRISSDLRDFYFINDDNALFFEAVKFGILKIREQPDLKQFDLFTDEYEKMRASIMPPGPLVRTEILKFVFNINALFPSWKISPVDLHVNINAEEDQIGEWAEDLTHVEYLVAEKAVGTNMIYNGIIHRQYRINPKMRSQVEEYFTKNNNDKKSALKQLEIFISYSHNDKIWAGQIKSRLEAYGYKTFLAHDVIKVDKDWRLEILKHLKSCQILVALITDSFNESEWTHQEVGHCIGNEKMIISLRLGGKLEGFLEARQALIVDGDDAIKISEKIMACIKDNSEFENAI